jgi:hypothetical protein
MDRAVEVVLHFGHSIQSVRLNCDVKQSREWPRIVAMALLDLKDCEDGTLNGASALREAAGLVSS